MTEEEKMQYDSKIVTPESLPNLTEEELMEMNSTLFECYSMNKALVISYLENGVLNKYCGVIYKIDFINQQIILFPKKKINIDQIYIIVVKSN